MKRTFLTFLFLVYCASVQAHPMGNFSINHYSSISFQKNQIVIHYIIDMAEIPTFQEMVTLDRNRDQQISNEEAISFSKAQAQRFGKALRLRLNGKDMPLNLSGSKMQILSGAGGLPTLLIIADYVIDSDFAMRNTLEYSDLNFPERIGWKEIVINRNNMVRNLSTGSRYQDRSHQLTQYPEDPTAASPQETTAQILFAATSTMTSANQEPSAGVRRDSNRREDRLTKLIRKQELTGPIIFLSLLIASGLGAMHALSPGHGKTILAGYLIGSRGTAYHALFLGAVVTLTHTVGVFALGLVTLYGSKYILPERLYPWLTFFSGISIVIIGATLFRRRLIPLLQKSRKEELHHHSDQRGHHHYDHYHDGHSHAPVERKSGAITLKSLIAVGISGGALPCPSALVVLLGAISLHKTGFGLLLIVAFSLGLAVVLSSLGILLVYAARFAARFDNRSRWLLRMPLASSLMITILGAVIAFRTFF